MELCGPCTAAATISAPVLAYDVEDTYTTATTTAASAGIRLYNHPFTKAVIYPPPAVTRLAASH
jgi:hypothetical protein